MAGESCVHAEVNEGKGLMVKLREPAGEVSGNDVMDGRGTNLRVKGATEDGTTHAGHGWQKTPEGGGASRQRPRAHVETACAAQRKWRNRRKRPLARKRYRNRR